MFEQNEEEETVDTAKTVETPETENPSNPKEGEETEENKEESEEESEESEEEGYLVDQVNKMHGIELQVDYKAEDGSDIDPDTPEGLYRRDLALQDVAVGNFVQYIQTNMPDVYKFMLHTRNGGTFADFNKVDTLPSFETVKTDLEAQKSLFKQSIKDKGIDDEDAIDLLLEAEIKKNRLADSVKKYIESKESSKQDSIKKLQEEVEAKDKAEEENYNTLHNVLTPIFDTNTFSLIRIPDSKKQENFTRFVENLKYDRDTGEFSYVQKLTGDNIANIAQVDYILNNPNSFGKSKDAKKKDQAITLRDKNKKLDTAKTNVSVSTDNSKISLTQHL